MMANDLQILSTAEASDLVKCVVSLCIASLESDTITRSTDHSKAVSIPRVLITAP